MKRGEFKIQSMIIATLIGFGLFMTLIASTITSLGGVYSVNDYDENTLANYSHLVSLNAKLVNATDEVDQKVTVDKNAFDYLAGIFNKVIAPFKFIYKSYSNLFTVTDQAVNDLNLFPEFRTWAQAVLITLVVIGIVMFSVYLKVRK